MRQSPGGRGGRSNWSRFQQHQHAPQAASGYAPQAPYSLQPSPQSYQPQPPPNASQVQRDVVAFVEAFRANQSHPSAPPNALTLDVVVRAVCSHF
ncbi:hypothetical protein PR001_g32500, partial [Phytophthora rubi]